MTPSGRNSTSQTGAGALGGALVAGSGYVIASTSSPMMFYIFVILPPSICPNTFPSLTSRINNYKSKFLYIIALLSTNSQYYYL